MLQHGLCSSGWVHRFIISTVQADCRHWCIRCRSSPTGTTATAGAGDNVQERRIRRAKPGKSVHDALYMTPLRGRFAISSGLSSASFFRHACSWSHTVVRCHLLSAADAPPRTSPGHLGLRTWGIQGKTCLCDTAVPCMRTVHHPHHAPVCHLCLPSLTRGSRNAVLVHAGTDNGHMTPQMLSSADTFADKGYTGGAAAEKAAALLQQQVLMQRDSHLFSSCKGSLPSPSVARRCVGGWAWGLQCNMMQQRMGTFQAPTHPMELTAGLSCSSPCCSSAGYVAWTCEPTLLLS